MYQGKKPMIPASTTHVVTKHRLADGHHSAVFPEHIPGQGSFHPGPRQGHGGSHVVTSKGRK